MKQPKPERPTNAPSGTVWFGGPIEWFNISLRILGEDLVPDELTKLMGRKPDEAGKKGEPLYRKDGSFMRVSKSGFWKVGLKPKDTDEWDCGQAMAELLAKLPRDVELWRGLAGRFKISFFVGLRMRAANKGFELSPELAQYIGERGISAGFDIYHQPDDGQRAEASEVSERKASPDQ